jgi:hypothetical protein
MAAASAAGLPVLLLVVMSTQVAPGAEAGSKQQATSSRKQAGSHVGEGVRRLEAAAGLQEARGCASTGGGSRVRLDWRPL